MDIERAQLIAWVFQILADSDIVWPKYGTDTIAALAERIVDALLGVKKNV